MKKIMLIVVIIATSFVQNTFAQKDNSPIDNVLSAYLNLKNALVANDAKTASASAKKMLGEIGKVPMDTMTTEQHTIWMKYTKKLSYDATHISEVAELEHDREHFTSLSKNMYAVVKAFPATTAVYYQFSPAHLTNKHLCSHLPLGKTDSKQLLLSEMLLQLHTCFLKVI